MNTELHKRTNDLGTTNAFLRSILASLRAGVAVVDDQLNVLVWNHRAEDLWGLRADEVQGQSLLTLGIGLPVEQLPVSAFLAGEASHQEVTVQAMNRRGRAIECLITCTPFLGAGGEREGVVLLMEEVEP
jgi:two-component system CheB/CheR fusion protein